jgi:hypothetical protein
MKKTAVSIGLLTVLYGAGAFAQAPTQQAGPAQQVAPTQQTAPRGDPRAQAPSSSAPARDRAAAQADSRTEADSRSDDAKDSENQHRELQAADTNMNGLVSRQEYMAHYEGLYEELKKDSAGMISLKDLTASTTASQPTR